MAVGADAGVEDYLDGAIVPEFEHVHVFAGGDGEGGSEVGEAPFFDDGALAIGEGLIVNDAAGVDALAGGDAGGDDADVFALSDPMADAGGHGFDGGSDVGFLDPAGVVGEGAVEIDADPALVHRMGLVSGGGRLESNFWAALTSP